jgi:hypothetical protein
LRLKNFYLAARVLLLGAATMAQIENDNFIQFWGGDRKASKVQIRIKATPDDSDVMENLKKHDEVLLFCGVVLEESK